MEFATHNLIRNKLFVRKYIKSSKRIQQDYIDFGFEVAFKSGCMVGESKFSLGFGKAFGKKYLMEVKFAQEFRKSGSGYLMATSRALSSVDVSLYTKINKGLKSKVSIIKKMAEGINITEVTTAIVINI